MTRGVVLVREHQVLRGAVQLYQAAVRVPGVKEAYPTLGRFDGVVYVEARDLHAFNAVCHHLERLEGVAGIEALVAED